MIEFIDSKDQNAYHGKRFDKTKLPDLDSAGFLSASTISKSGDMFKFMSLEDTPPTSDMAWGSLVDLMWLTPEDWDDHVVLIPKDAPKKPTKTQIESPRPTAIALERINWWQAFDKKCFGKMAIPHSLKEEIDKAVSNLNAHPLSQHIKSHSKAQVILEGESDKLHPGPESIRAKAMMDLLPSGGTITVDGKTVELDSCVVDLKQTNDIGPFGLRKAMRTFEYALKTKWYLKMLQAAGDEKRVNSILIFQHSKPPYDIRVIQIDPTDLEYADTEITKRIDAMRKVDPKDLNTLFNLEVPIVTTQFK